MKIKWCDTQRIKSAIRYIPDALLTRVRMWIQQFLFFYTDDRIPSRFQSKDGDDLCEEEEEGEVSSAGDEVIATELGADPTSAWIGWTQVILISFP